MAKKKEIEETEVEAPIEETPEIKAEETPVKEVVETPEVVAPTPEPETEAPKAKATPVAKCECEGAETIVRNRNGAVKVCQDCGKIK